MKQFSIFFLLIMFPIFAWCNDNNIFTATSSEGVVITFKVISEQEKTASVGDDKNPAIDINTQGMVSIPQNVNGYKIVEIGRKAFWRCQEIISIKLPESIKFIGDAAFDRCSNLQTVVIPYGTQKINTHAFSECEKLQSITIPATVTDFGLCIFLYNNNMMSVFSYIVNPPSLHEWTFSTIPVPDIDSEVTAFDSEPRNEATLYVPKGCKEKYEQTQGWNIFHDIVEMEYSPYDHDGDGVLTLNDITTLINVYLEMK